MWGSKILQEICHFSAIGVRPLITALLVRRLDAWMSSQFRENRFQRLAAWGCVKINYGPKYCSILFDFGRGIHFSYFFRDKMLARGRPEVKLGKNLIFATGAPPGEHRTAKQIRKTNSSARKSNSPKQPNFENDFLETVMTSRPRYTSAVTLFWGIFAVTQWNKLDFRRMHAILVLRQGIFRRKILRAIHDRKLRLSWSRNTDGKYNWYIRHAHSLNAFSVLLFNITCASILCNCTPTTCNRISSG